MIIDQLLCVVVYGSVVIGVIADLIDEYGPRPWREYAFTVVVITTITTLVAMFIGWPIVSAVCWFVYHVDICVAH